MALQDLQHVLRVAYILMGVVAAALIVRAQLVPPTFGEYGAYRGASVQEIRDTAMKYHGVENCKSCHEEQWNEWAQSPHGSVACESCHGPGMEHSQTDVEPRPKILGTRELMARSHDLCLSCHARIPGRRANFPQVEPVEHLARYSISVKYDVAAGNAGHVRRLPAPESAPSPEPENRGQPAAEVAVAQSLPDEYSCMFCHGKEGMLADSEDTQHLVVTPERMAGDVHWQKGLQCHDCHGGNPKLEEYVDHRDDSGFRPLGSRAEIPEFCGRCHSDRKYMERYQSHPKTNQVEAFWSGVHGRHLKSLEDPAAEEGAEPVTCLSCHPKHGMRPVDDPRSSTHPSQLMKTCGNCHFDVEYMRRYRPAPDLPQLTEYLSSRHGRPLEGHGDETHATCTTCHGHHAIRAIDPLVSPDNCVPCHKGHTPLR